MEGDNLHRDTDKRGRATECNVEWIVFGLPLDLSDCDRRLGMNHRRDRIQDAPYDVHDRFCLCMKGTSRNPKEII